MPFDTARFLKTRLKPRESEIEVPGLKDFFENGDRPIWKIRGLEGLELGQVNEAAAKTKDIVAIVEKLLSTKRSEKADAVADALGVGDNVPYDLAKRIEIFIVGSVEPPVTLELAKKILQTFPIEFYDLTTHILKLTGEGHMPGEATPFGQDTT